MPSHFPTTPILHRLLNLCEIGFRLVLLSKLGNGEHEVTAQFLSKGMVLSQVLAVVLDGVRVGSRLSVHNSSDQGCRKG
ncbi:hypothetical protein D3C78_1598730 [compost metagenome]